MGIWNKLSKVSSYRKVVPWTFIYVSPRFTNCWHFPIFALAPSLSVFSEQFESCSIAKSCPTLFGPVACSTPGFPVLHYLSVFAQTRVRWVSDAIHPFWKWAIDIMLVRHFTLTSSTCISYVQNSLQITLSLSHQRNLTKMV